MPNDRDCSCKEDKLPLSGFCKDDLYCSQCGGRVAWLSSPQNRLPDRPEAGGRQQAAEEQVPVAGQAAPQRADVTDQAARVGQLIHTLTISTAGQRLGHLTASSHRDLNSAASALLAG